DLTEGLLGVVPTAPGYARIRFVPGAAKEISWAKGVIPTPLGKIVASWRREGDKIIPEISVPKGVVVEE
ncbi:MAG: hypothetical protein MJ240_12100, partial [Kiritimatiellae bacterium]|nr:hypothetical protein [Kiritimatiellia bacterium]